MFKKSASLKDRANAALASVQRNSLAMGMLRSKLESRISLIINQNSKSDDNQELNKVLELVRNGEMILHEISERIESARYLEEFVAIMDSAASSVSEIKGDLEQMVPAAEAALEEMQDAISKMSTGIPAELRKQIDPAILAEVTATIAAGKTAEVQTTTPAQEEQEPVPA